MRMGGLIGMLLHNIQRTVVRVSCPIWSRFICQFLLAGNNSPKWNGKNPKLNLSFICVVNVYIYLIKKIIWFNLDISAALGTSAWRIGPWSWNQSLCRKRRRSETGNEEMVLALGFRISAKWHPVSRDFLRFGLMFIFIMFFMIFRSHYVFIWGRNHLRDLPFWRIPRIMSRPPHSWTKRRSSVAISGCAEVLCIWLSCLVKNRIPSEQTGMTCQFLLDAWFISRAKALVSCLNGWSAQSHRNVWFGCLSWTCPAGHSERWAYSNVEYGDQYRLFVVFLALMFFWCSWCLFSEDILGVVFLMYDMPLISNKTSCIGSCLKSTALWFQLVRELRAYILLLLTAFPFATQPYHTHKEAFEWNQLVVPTILHVRTNNVIFHTFVTFVPFVPLQTALLLSQIPNAGNEV